MRASGAHLERDVPSSARVLRCSKFKRKRSVSEESYYAEIKVATAGPHGGSADCTDVVGDVRLHAQYPYYNTFDDATTISTVASYNPPPIITRFDYGNGGPSSTNSTGWSNAADHTGNGGGSVMQSITFSNSPVAQQGAFTLDIAGGSGINVSNVSFYIMLRARLCGEFRYVLRGRRRQQRLFWSGHPQR